MSDDTENPNANLVSIDENNLDRECIRQPGICLQAAHTAAEAKRDVMEIKLELEVKEADLIRRIRNTPVKFGCEDKVTDKVVAATVLLQEDYQALEKKLIRAQHRAALADALVNALEHKKRTLTLLVDLHGMGYFSEPKVSDKGREAVREMIRKKAYRSRSSED